MLPQHSDSVGTLAHVPLAAWHVSTVQASPSLQSTSASQVWSGTEPGAGSTHSPREEMCSHMVKGTRRGSREKFPSPGVSTQLRRSERGPSCQWPPKVMATFRS